jgi:hypothetical protein
MKVDSFQAVVVARADSIRRDSLARADSLRIDSAGVADTLPPRPPAGRGQPPRVLQQQLGRGGQPQPGDMPPAGPLPFQELVVIPARPLAPGRYLLDVSGLQNISGRTGGGGTAPFEISPPPRRPARDTTDTSSLPVGAFDAGLERRSLDRPGFRPVTPGARE